jgi:hypothetical protein
MGIEIFISLALSKDGIYIYKDLTNFPDLINVERNPLKK